MADIRSTTIHVDSICATARNESEWQSSNPVLKLGEIAVSLNCQKSAYTSLTQTAGSGTFTRVKIGDGSSNWRTLPYLDAKNGDDISAVASLTASALSSLDSRVAALEGAVDTLSNALLAITNSVISNVTKEE